MNTKSITVKQARTKQWQMLVLKQEQKKQISISNVSNNSLHVLIHIRMIYLIQRFECAHKIHLKIQHLKQNPQPVLPIYIGRWLLFDLLS